MSPVKTALEAPKTSPEVSWYTKGFFSTMQILAKSHLSCSFAALASQEPGFEPVALVPGLSKMGYANQLNLF